MSDLRHDRFAQLADEIEDLLHTAFGLLRHYRAEASLERVVDREFAKVGAAG